MTFQHLSFLQKTNSTVGFEVTNTNTLVLKLADFFSFSNLADTFYIPGTDELFSSVLAQKYLQNQTTYFADFYSSDLYNLVYSSVSMDFDSLSYFYNPDLVKNLDFFKSTQLFMGDFYEVASIKNDALKLLELYPDFYLTLHTFECLSHDDDGSLYAHLSMPEEKFYYPEPFVASPSFVHEDLWFIHILHYQH